MSFHANTLIKSARKAHACVQCSTKIEVGSAYWKSSGRFEGDFYCNSTHPECWEAAVAYAALHKLYGEDWPWFADGEFFEEDRAWMREHHPIVAERLGWTATAEEAA